MAVVGGSALVGMGLFRILDGRGDVDGNEQGLYNRNNTARRNANEKMSPEEARLIAMLENAKESSWRENIETAVDAQERFMLPGRPHKHNTSQGKFMDKIEKRSREILRNQHEQIDQNERRRQRNNDVDDTEETKENNSTISYWKQNPNP
eukprot:CAMPEP_0168183662 /NCGR_PEP_ID=MMETSP0139_2-20121125/12724_1 /TAXON_ID=44445 /ORGANISM="Pseudo-nitzschia australis, Strain 10249 10 AB" /LENGTH=149 /DNA_ID=CAMNT_0008105029 /DNA_START=250 /DNA_END=699 /DNA_ORIENTATION=-